MDEIQRVTIQVKAVKVKQRFSCGAVHYNRLILRQIWGAVSFQSFRTRILLTCDYWYFFLWTAAKWYLLVVLFVFCLFVCLFVCMFHFFLLNFCSKTHFGTLRAWRVSNRKRKWKIKWEAVLLTKSFIKNYIPKQRYPCNSFFFSLVW